MPSIRYSTERGDHLEGPAESSGPGVHEDDRAAALGRSEGYNSKRVVVASTALGLATVVAAPHAAAAVESEQSSS